MNAAPAFLIRQAYIAPLAMLVPMIAGLLAPEYSSLSQHMSELELRSDWIAWTVRLGAGVSGVSVILFAIGCFLMPRGIGAAGADTDSGVSGGAGLSGAGFSYTGFAALLFGVGMVSNGIFIIGSPLHGLYGLPIFLVLVPAFFVAEFSNSPTAQNWPKWFVGFSLLISFLGLTYMWALLVGFDPAALRGLTQRVSSLLSFGWYGVAAFAVLAARTDR